MYRNQKVALGSAIGAVLILYLTGLLWPLVRLVLTCVALAGLSASAYLGFRYFRDKKINDEKPDARQPKPGHAIATIAATAMTFMLLSLVPQNEPAPSTQPEGNRSVAIARPKSQPKQPAAHPTPKPSVPKAVATAKPPAQPSNSKTVPRTSNPRTQTTPVRSRSSTAQSTKPKRKMSEEQADRAVADFMGALLGAAMEQERREQSDPRYQRFKQSLEKARVCPRCGGAGSYRFVDGKGVLQVRSCPSCTIPGRSF